jgi:hypothetical protein
LFLLPYFSRIHYIIQYVQLEKLRIIYQLSYLIVERKKRIVRLMQKESPIHSHNHHYNKWMFGWHTTNMILNEPNFVKLSLKWSDFCMGIFFSKSKFEVKLGKKFTTM